MMGKPSSSTINSGGDQHQRRKQDQQYRGGDDVEDSLDQCSPRSLTETTTKNQPACPQGIEPDLAEHALEMTRHVQHQNARQAAVEQFAQGQPSPATLADRNDDLVEHSSSLTVSTRVLSREITMFAGTANSSVTTPG